MDRRTFIKALASILTAVSLPPQLMAKTLVGNQISFLESLKENPWLLGYLGTSETELQGNLKIIHGKIPKDLRGYFFRNGPARHNIGPDRFAHWFDAPGMVQRFSFSDTGLNHYGRLIDTTRNAAETKSGRILFSGFGTNGAELTSGGSADAQSVANISLLDHAGELLALWEGGSPHVIDPETLDTKGLKSWSNETTGLPFGAHPRMDQDGSLWNIGYSINPAALILYHISADGELLQTHIIPQSATPMVHDFMITASKIIVVLPPYNASNPDGDTFIDHFEWRGNDPTEVLIIDKNDLANVTIVEMETFWVYHFGNAYDLSPSEIGFDFALHDNPGFMTKDAFAAMDGSWDGSASASPRYAQAKIDLKTKTIQLVTMPELGQVEFIQTDMRQNLSAHKYALLLAQPDGAAAFGFDRLLLIDRESGKTSYFDVGKAEILEEHLIVPKPNSVLDFWIIGTSLNWKKQVTNLSVYEGTRLADGPVMKAELDLPLPLGLHGIFVSA